MGSFRKQRQKRVLVNDGLAEACGLLAVVLGFYLWLGIVHDKGSLSELPRVLAALSCSLFCVHFFSVSFPEGPPPESAILVSGAVVLIAAAGVLSCCVVIGELSDEEPAEVRNLRWVNATFTAASFVAAMLSWLYHVNFGTPMATWRDIRIFGSVNGCVRSIILVLIRIRHPSTTAYPPFNLSFAGAGAVVVMWTWLPMQFTPNYRRAFAAQCFRFMRRPPSPSNTMGRRLRRSASSSKQLAGVPLVSSPSRQSAHETDTDTGTSTCGLCMDAPMESAFIPCGHVFACEACADKIVKSTGSCPVCRRRAHDALKLYHT